MATDKRTDLITVGAADIYINGVDVGHLEGQVQVQYTREKLLFKPAHMLGNVKAFAVGEGAQISANVAQITAANIKLALGVTTTISESTTLSGIPASVSWDPSSGSSWDYLTFGGAKAEREFGVRLEHTKPDGKKIVVCLYKAHSNTDLVLPFADKAFVIHNLVLEALADATRSEGDQIGFVAVQTN